jgi:hypothetical protein
MTKLDDFLNNKIDKEPKGDKILGSFSCQENGCDEINTEAILDDVNHKLYWICFNNHKSSVAF